jgi:predicted homoserine dehydrogenase-like protein
MVANGTGLVPDVERLHHPVLRTVEIPEVLCPVEEGGILGTRGAIDVVTDLRHADGPGGGGGVFIVVSADSAYSRHILSTKGCHSNHRSSAALIYRPYHLCGVETGMSILCAALLGLPTGATEVLPRFDVVARVREDRRAGQALDYEDVQCLIRPAGAVEDGAPLSLHMALWNELAVDVAAGTVITLAEVVPPAGSTLWQLRRQQDELLMRS